jgi:molybdate transport system ATP-binding protein
MGRSSMTGRKRPLIELQHCSLVLGDHTILDEVSFELRAGERWALIGTNGSGKTMLLKMIRGDMWPTPTGRERRVYRFDGGAGEAASSKHLIAYVGAERQDKYVRYDWDLTVTQVVTTGLFDEDIPLTKPSAAQRAKVDRMLRRFGLWGLRSRKLLSLSYGQRRLTLVARAFVSDAKVLLLDEVFNGLDIRAKEKLRKALEAPRERHAWIITSHRPEELPRNVTHVARIAAGRMVSAAIARKNPLPGPPPQAGEGKNIEREWDRPARLRPIATSGADASEASTHGPSSDHLLPFAKIDELCECEHLRTAAAAFAHDFQDAVLLERAQHVHDHRFAGHVLVSAKIAAVEDGPDEEMIQQRYRILRARELDDESPQALVQDERLPCLR